VLFLKQYTTTSDDARASIRALEDEVFFNTTKLSSLLWPDKPDEAISASLNTTLQ
jgi:hypothetical protein